jgi:hypothetical protein
MSSIKSRVVPAVFRRKSERKSRNSISQKSISNTIQLYQYYIDEISSPVLDKAIEKAIEKSDEFDSDVSRDELNEFRNFHVFISSHVQPTTMCDTPCMLLWAEWVRFCLKEARSFPHIILEKEFRDLVVNHLGFTVLDDEARGQVYPGVRFVWRKNISQNKIGSESAMV